MTVVTQTLLHCPWMDDELSIRGNRGPRGDNDNITLSFFVVRFSQTIWMGKAGNYCGWIAKTWPRQAIRTWSFNEVHQNNVFPLFFILTGWRPPPPPPPMENHQFLSRTQWNENVKNRRPQLASGIYCPKDREAWWKMRRWCGEKVHRVLDGKLRRAKNEGVNFGKRRKEMNTKPDSDTRGRFDILNIAQ